MCYLLFWKYPSSSPCKTPKSPQTKRRMLHLRPHGFVLTGPSQKQEGVFIWILASASLQIRCNPAKSNMDSSPRFNGRASLTRMFRVAKTTKMRWGCAISIAQIWSPTNIPVRCLLKLLSNSLMSVSCPWMEINDLTGIFRFGKHLILPGS